MKLFHSNYIAEIYGIEGHAIYMKYYDQGSLREIIDKGEAKKGRYFLAKQICQGVKDIHALNYVHSDLKCSNVLVEKFSNGNLGLFISDFGVAGLKGSWPITCTIGFYPKDFFSKPLCFEDDIFALMIGKREFSKDITANNVLVETAIYVPSKRIRQFIYEHRDQYNVLHIATIAAEYMKTRKIEAFKALIDMSNSQFEKELLQMAVMDFEKKKSISNETLQFYLDNDPRKNQKPNVPFCEVLPLPIFLKKGDIVRYKDGRKTRHAIIGEIPDEKKYIDFSDQVYLAYALDKTLDGDNFLFDAHLHLHICDINKTVSSKLTQQELDNLEKIKKAL